jgi:hypothetical protein
MIEYSKELFLLNRVFIYLKTEILLTTDSSFWLDFSTRKEESIGKFSLKPLCESLSSFSMD